MNKMFVLVLITLIGARSATAQKIEVQAAGSTAITQVQTALNHLTVIQLSEPVLSVATGSQAFKVEWRENKVFIEPTEPNASTNLFIWTKSGRLNYELEPAGMVAQMDFAIDQPPENPPPPKPVAASIDPPNEATVAKESLLGARPVHLTGYKLGKNRVQLLVKDLFWQGDRLYIRYTVDNTTRRAYEVGKPQLFFLPEPPELIDRREVQLTQLEAERIDIKDQKPLEIVDQEVRSVRVEPGQETLGLVGVKLPNGQRERLVLRLVLPNHGREEIAASIVL